MLAFAHLLAPHLNAENHEQLLARASGLTKEEVAELVAALSPRRPPPPPMIRKMPQSQAFPLAQPRLAPPPPRPVIPVADDTYKVQFTASREFRAEIREAQDLMRHRVPDGDLAAIFRAALKLLVTEVKKERFAVGRKSRSEPDAKSTESRHIPDAIKRAVYGRDGGTYTT